MGQGDYPPSDGGEGGEGTVTSKIVLVGGTWALKRPHLWTRPHAPMATALRARGLDLLHRSRGFVWTTHLAIKRDETWAVAGESLLWYTRMARADGFLTKGERPSGIFHSHGGQVWAYSGFFGQDWDTVMLISTPIRQDLASVYARALARTKRLICVYSDTSDKTQVEGMLGWDPRTWCSAFWPQRYVTGCHERICFPGVGHSGEIDPDFFDYFNLWARFPGGREVVRGELSAEVRARFAPIPEPTIMAG